MVRRLFDVNDRRCPTLGLGFHLINEQLSHIRKNNEMF